LLCSIVNNSQLTGRRKYNAYRKKALINIRYFIAPALILVALAGVMAGGAWTWTGVGLLGIGIIFDTLVTRKTSGAGFDENGEPYGIPWLQNAVMYSMLPVFVALQLGLAYQIYSGMWGVELLGAVLSTGIFAGIGIIYGHELSHTKGFSFIISRWMMGLSGSAHFCYAHVYNHHLELASEDDPATAPRGRNLYEHFFKSHLGQSKFLFEMEKGRLRRLGKPFLSLSNRWIRGYMMSFPTIFLFFLAGGWVGVACMALVWMISNFELEALNYLEHYGLVRVKSEPIDYRHSWDNSTLFTSWFFIEIGRQADHHDRGETHFWELDEVGAPNTGIGYFTLFALALVPPVFNRFMKKHLDDWDKNFATEAEREIAKQFV
jgi:alkane 1-monooxygenase